MSTQKFHELQENLKLRKKIMNLGLGCSIVGPTGPQGLPGPTGPTGSIGPIGPIGPIAITSTEGLLFTGFEETNISREMLLIDSWLLPNESEYFSFPSETEIEVQPGVYEITFSCLIQTEDDNHGATVYLKNSDGAAIRDLHYNLEIGEGKKMNFSQTIIFRFEETTTLQASVDILGDEGTANISISSANLIMKKIHEN